jgi:two-component system nitrogen regulation sensor histidine kinase NtrY
MTSGQHDHDSNEAEAAALRDMGERSRRRNEIMVIGAAALAVVAFALYETSSQGAAGSSGGNVASFLLVNLNIVLLLVAGFLVARNLAKVVLERRRGVLGSHLRSRLVAAFVAVSLFPALLMAVFSYGVLTDTIDDWLSSEVETTLEGAWNVAHSYYRDTADDSIAHARFLASTIVRENVLEPSSDKALRDLVTQYQASFSLGSVSVVTANGETRLQALLPRGDAEPQEPQLNGELVAKTLAGEEYAEVVGFGEDDAVRGSAPLLATDGSVLGAVVVDSFVVGSSKRSAENILANFREFRSVKLNRQPLKNLYLITIILASTVVVLVAIWLGMMMARSITEPIGRLASATRQVAEGNWDTRLGEAGDDEVGTLIHGFNTMTAELRSTHGDLESRRVYIENVLANVDAGVLSIDARSRVETINPAAVTLLGVGDEEVRGRDIEELLAALSVDGVLLELFRNLKQGKVDSGAQVTIENPDAGLSLLVTATHFLSAGGELAGFVLFFENVSEMLAAQRAEAWREVARRVAHEIKNPLTPIQLSAQRLGRKLSKVVTGDDAKLLDECVGTIVSEVEGLKNLVNDFSRFARKSQVEKAQHDLAPLIEETLRLFRQSRPDLEIVSEVEDSLPDVLLDRDAVRRAMLNLLDNAVAAVSEPGASGGEPPCVGVHARYDPGLSRVVVEVVDNGPGIPAGQRGRVLEPYFSTKIDGTGLGLAIVSSMAAEHRAYLRIGDNEPRGTKITIEFPLAAKDAEA